MLVNAKNIKHISTYVNTIKNPIPEEGSLWIPERIPKNVLTLQEIASNNKIDVAKNVLFSFLKNEIDYTSLSKIVENAFNFPTPLVNLNNNNYILELTHGETKAFKDIGARFSTFITKFFNDKNNLKMGTFVVATSGDTGGATVSACNKVGINNMILYPYKNISEYQRKQMTDSKFKNTIPLAYEGNFDDCQKKIKEVLSNKNLNTLSGNSINIFRLIAQVVYYYWIALELYNKKNLNLDEKFNVTIPSGNLGNAVAALMAKIMGAPIDNIIIATNNNSVISNDYILGIENNSDYKLQHNKYKKTLSSAMDVCIPSNLIRFEFLCNHLIKKNILPSRFIYIKKVNENKTIETIENTYKKNNYIADPHTAVGIYASNYFNLSGYNIILSTAHPIKFGDIINSLNLDIPKLNPVLNSNETIIRVRTSFFDKINQFNKEKLNITFIGMPGSGKSTFGKKISKCLCMYHIDNDKVIENIENMQLCDIIEEKGLDEFSKIENKICTSVIKENKYNTVFSPGGSLCLDKNLVDLYKSNSIMVWLDTSISIIDKRVGDLQKRGVVMNKGDTIYDLYSKRKPYYKDSYDIRILSNDYDKLISLFNIWYR